MLFVFLTAAAAAAAATAAVAIPPFEIAPGVMMPAVSLGHPDDEGSESASAELWIKLGGIGIDTAFDYHNQDQVGQALKAAASMGRNRSSIFITTKISPDSCTAAAALAAVKEDLKEMAIDQADLVLHHFPCSTAAGNKAIWIGLNHAKTAGLTRAIGVSNYKQKDIEGILALELGKPAVNQCSMGVGNHDDATIKYCQSVGVVYESYSPLRHLDFKNTKLNTIATAHSVSAAQVALRWVTQLDCPVATSPGINKEYSIEDLSLGNFTLSKAEMDILSAI